MKAVILEKRKGKAAILREDGSITRIRTDAEVGQTIELKDTQPVFANLFSGFSLKKAAAAAMSVVLIPGSIFGWNFMTVQACSYVSLDVNPSIEYTLNRLDRVIDVRAVNEDADAIVAVLDENDLHGKRIADALRITGSVLEDFGYINDENYLLLNVSTDNTSRREKLETIAREELEQNSSEASHIVITGSDVETRNRAQEAGISAGRYEEIREIGNNDPQEFEKHKDQSIDDLLTETGKIAPKEDHPDVPENNKSPREPEDEWHEERPADDRSGNPDIPGEKPDDSGDPNKRPDSEDPKPFDGSNEKPEGENSADPDDRNPGPEGDKNAPGDENRQENPDGKPPENEGADPQFPNNNVQKDPDPAQDPDMSFLSADHSEGAGADRNPPSENNRQQNSGEHTGQRPDHRH